jgi:glycosyltransferase involved in cell wall biosynthesis
LTTELTVSVVLPVYNGSATLARAIDSVLSQTHRKLELIVVDDGSSEPADHVIEKYAGESRLRYLRKPNGGVASARNFGVEHSSGDVIAFCDQDDHWLPHKLALQLEALSDPATALVYGWVHVDGGVKSRDLKPTLRGSCFNDLLNRNFMSCCTVIVRKSALLDVGGFDEDRRLSGCDDWFVWLKIALKYKIDVTPQTVAVYSLHESNYSKNESKMLTAALCCLDKLQAYDTAAEVPGQQLVAARRNVYLHYATNLRWQGQFREAGQAYLSAWRLQRNDVVHGLRAVGFLWIPPPVLQAVADIKRRLSKAGPANT